MYTVIHLFSAAIHLFSIIHLFGTTIRSFHTQDVATVHSESSRKFVGEIWDRSGRTIRENGVRA